MTEDRNDGITKKRSTQTRLFKQKKKHKNRKTLASLPAIHQAMNEAQESIQDLNAWGLNTEAARELYAALNRIRYLYGNVLTRAHVTQAVKRSNQEIEQALNELESAGLIMYNRADDEVQVIV
jgi:acyl carrier protein phosphodiesterase